MLRAGGPGSRSPVDVKPQEFVCRQVEKCFLNILCSLASEVINLVDSGWLIRKSLSSGLV